MWVRGGDIGLSSSGIVVWSPELAALSEWCLSSGGWVALQYGYDSLSACAKAYIDQTLDDQTF